MKAAIYPGHGRPVTIETLPDPAHRPLALEGQGLYQRLAEGDRRWLPTAEPLPRSHMPCGQPKFSSRPSAPVSSDARMMSRH